MRIWFDLSNSPHINMFYDLIRELEADGHTVIITSRPLANTVELLDQRGLNIPLLANITERICEKIIWLPDPGNAAAKIS